VWLRERVGLNGFVKVRMVTGYWKKLSLVDFVIHLTH
jgi:hypothetical protein